MKGEQVGTNAEVLLWPDTSALSALTGLLRPRNTLTAVDNAVVPSDLLWPAFLINQQARARKSKSLAVPFSIISFVVSAILGIIIGPLQIILLATNQYDYSWISAVYYPAALKYVMLVASFLAVLSFVSLVSAWRARPHQARLASIFCLGSLAEVAAIWFLRSLTDLPPHLLSLILLAISASCFLVAMLLRNQYTAQAHNGRAMQIFLVALMAISAVEAIGGMVYFAQANAQDDSTYIQQITAEQTAAQLDGMSLELSNAVFTLCEGGYQAVYLTAAETSGLFECDASGQVYSVAELPQQHPQSIDSAATYLGTTKDSSLSNSLPGTHYLYRSIPQALSEDELAIMVSGNSEAELLDNFIPGFLEYWQTHNAHNLYLNVFYVRDAEAITTTRDFILMAALDTMALVDKLPQGNTIKGYSQGEPVNYLFQPDLELTALHELGAQSDLMTADLLDTLTFRRHLSVHLQAGESFDYDGLYQRLSESFTGGV